MVFAVLHFLNFKRSKPLPPTSGGNSAFNILLVTFLEWKSKKTSRARSCWPDSCHLYLVQEKQQSFGTSCQDGLAVSLGETRQFRYLCSLLEAVSSRASLFPLEPFDILSCFSYMPMFSPIFFMMCVPCLQLYILLFMFQQLQPTSLHCKFVCSMWLFTSIFSTLHQLLNVIFMCVLPSFICFLLRLVF